MRGQSPVPQPDHERVFVPRQVGVEALDVTIDLRRRVRFGSWFFVEESAGFVALVQVSGGSERQADDGGKL